MGLVGIAHRPAVPGGPGAPGLAGQVLAWAEQASADAGSDRLTTHSSSNEPHIGAALAERGYAKAGDGDPYYTCLGRDLGDPADLPPVPAPADGYEIRSLTDPANLAERAAAHRAAWDSQWITAERHARMQGLWPYKPEFDLIAVATATGEAVAYYQGWLDEVSGVGLFEPVGTHAGHRRLGLSRALGIAVLHAFAAAGARRATVFPRGDGAYPVPRLVYESLGFTEYSRTHLYTKTFA